MLLTLLACGSKTVAFSNLDVVADPQTGTLTVLSSDQVVLEALGVDAGVGSAEVEFNTGSYLFENVEADFVRSSRLKVRDARDELLSVLLEDENKEPVAIIDISSVGDGELLFVVQAASPRWDEQDRLRVRFACPEGPVLGAGGHAFDVDHRGEAFPLWVAEPGVGKSDLEGYPEDWFLTGTRHASSFPQPFFLFPQVPIGVELGTSARVEADVCAGDAGVFAMTAWSGGVSVRVTPGENALQVIERHALSAGTPMVPPDWAFGAWNDAIRGEERVKAVAAALRGAKASVSAIWTEDWKGGEQTSYGYHLTAEWAVDEELYPNVLSLAEELEAQGFAWMAYFSPFVAQDSEAAAEAESLVIRTESGDPYWFLSFTFKPTSVLDLSREDARAWAEEKMQAALDLGFDGWMTDFAEWLPTDAAMAGGDAWLDHNAYPLWWQTVSQDAVEGTEATYFSRSGWIGTSVQSPITWAGDQRTNFADDDGFPTVVPMGLGLGVGGVPFYTHDIAGYNSLGNEPSSKELFFRWCTLGAFTPIMRTHHGAFDTDNWQFDSDEETLAHYARYTREHGRLFPYLRGLADQAKMKGTPLVLPPAAYFEGADWSQITTWMLGPSLLVAPVLEEGSLSVEVVLPGSEAWYDYWTGERAVSGTFEVPLNAIAVFVPTGSVIPTLTAAPDTFWNNADDALVTLDEADKDRTIRVFGKDGSFVEADGTHYVASGTASAPGSSTQTLTQGEITVQGLTLVIEGTTERSYTVEVYP